VTTVFAPKKKFQELSINPIAKLSLIKDTNVRKMLQSPCEMSELVVVTAAMVV
jgi:hypothetical protein